MRILVENDGIEGPEAKGWERSVFVFEAEQEREKSNQLCVIQSGMERCTFATWVRVQRPWCPLSSFCNSLSQPDTAKVNKMLLSGVLAADLATASGYLLFVDLSQDWPNNIYRSENLSWAAGQECLHQWTEDWFFMYHSTVISNSNYQGYETSPSIELQIRGAAYRRLPYHDSTCDWITHLSWDSC